VPRRVQIVWIVDGAIRKVGSYKELSNDDEFMELVGSQIISEDVEGGDDDGDNGDAGGSGSGVGGTIKAEGGAAAATRGLAAQPAVKKGLTGVEDRSSGALSTGVISLYSGAAGGFLWLAVVIVLFVLEQSSKIFSDTWPGLWTNDSYAALSAAWLYARTL
jgi:hypothetical protein